MPSQTDTAEADSSAISVAQEASSTQPSDAQARPVVSNTRPLNPSLYERVIRQAGK